MKNTRYGMMVLLLVMLLTGCSENYMTSIYDNNGEISSTSNRFNLDLQEQTIDGKQFIGKVSKIEGMDTIWTLDADEDMEVDMTYLLNVTSGKLKLVLISPDNSTTNLIESTDKSDLNSYATNTLQIKKGLNRIKMVAGANTCVEFDITISSGRFEELGM